MYRFVLYCLIILYVSSVALSISGFISLDPLAISSNVLYLVAVSYIANKFFSLSKNEILARGYRYREPDTREYAITMPAKELPDHIKDAPDSILNEVVGCGACPRGFKIIKAELDFLRQMNLPLPRRCPFCRIEEKLDKWVKESRLVKRSCDKCGVEFETPHTKEEVAYILCKKCWRVEFS